MSSLPWEQTLAGVRAELGELRTVTVSRDVLAREGYTEIVSQDGEGEVVLRNDCGGLEVFAVRDSFAGWSIPTEQGKVLEFCRSIRE